MLEGHKTYIGAGIVFASEVARFFDIEVDPEAVTNSVMTLIGVAVVIYGRFVARPK